MNDKELTVKKIEQLSFEKRAMNGFKYFTIATCAASIWTGAVLAPVSLGCSIFCFAIATIYKKLGYNYAKDAIKKTKEQLAIEKSSITYEEYKMYHEQPKVIKKAKELYNSIRYINRRGFASSNSQTNNTTN